MEKYEQKALDFLYKTGTTLKIKYLKHDIYKNFNDGKFRDIYQITLSRGFRDYSFTFGQSLKDSDNGKTPPTEYDILACLGTHPTESFEVFCQSFKYNTNNKHTKNIYNAVKDEYQNLQRLYSEQEMELLQEIQ